jgi:hypothetical protein
MWIWFAPAILAVIYCLKYWNLSHPPPGDLISPLIIITLAIGVGFSYSANETILLTITGLFFDALADFHMDKQTMGLSMMYFSSGHIIRQFSFLQNNDPNNLLFMTMGCAAVLMLGVIMRVSTRLLILPYAAIMLFTLLNISWAMGTFFNGFVLFIISDLIIAWELIIGEIPHRPFRIVVVPLLFWIAEYVLLRQSLG